MSQELCKSILESTSKEDIQEKVKQALNALEKANFISNVSSVKFNMPYNSSYSGDYDENTLSAMLDESENEVLNKLLKENKDLKKLLNLAYDMEYQSMHWNSSVC